MRFEDALRNWKVLVRDFGLESLRAYLAEFGPRTYSLVG
jgi:hypothetical protein